MSLFEQIGYQSLFKVIQALIILIGIRFVLFKIIRPRLLARRGPAGEKRVAQILNSLPNDLYITLNDVLIPSAGEATTQIDHIVVSKFGIFVIETKNFSGWIFGNSQQPFWTQRFNNGKKFKFQNPIHQNFAHIKALENIVGSQFSEKFHSVVAFAGSARINPKDGREIPGVLVFSHLKESIQNQNQESLTAEEVREIIEKINAATITAEGSREQHVEAISKNLKNKENLATSNVCPKCGQKLIARKGKYGNFIGCSSYPSCKFTSRSS